MSTPQTVSMGDIPQVPQGFRAEATGRSAQVIQIDNGKAVHVVAICAAICGMCLAITFGMYIHMTGREDEVNRKLTVSENHWRNIETDVEVLKHEVRHAE